MYTNAANATKQTLRNDEIITIDNVRHRGETLALRAVKVDLGREGTPFLRKAYFDLVGDMKNFDVPGYIISDSYDIAQETIAFLCGHIGRKLTDIIIDRKGDRATVLVACLRAVNRYIQSRQRRVNKTVDFNDLKDYQIEIPFDWDTDELNDYTSVDAKIAAMNLTERQTEVLEYRMACGSNRKTAYALSVSDSSIRSTLKTIRAKYFNIFANAPLCG